MIRVRVPSDLDPANYVWSVCAPAITSAASTYSTTVYQESKLSLRESEAARVRTAQINGCRVCQNWRITRDLPGYLAAKQGIGRLDRDIWPDEEFYLLIADWRSVQSFSDREKVALELAERMGEEPKALAIDDAFWARAHEHFSDAEIVDLTFSVGCWIALGRATHVLGLDSFCVVAPQ